MKKAPKITPDYTLNHKHSDSTVACKEDAKVNSSKNMRSDFMLSGIYVDVSILTLNGVSTYSVTVQVVDKNGEIQLCSKVDNILKCENNLQLILDFHQNSLHFLQYNDDNKGNMPKIREVSILKLKAMNVFNNFDDAWFGLIGSNVCVSDILMDCSKPSKKYFAAAKYFNEDFNTLEQYLAKPAEENLRKRWFQARPQIQMNRIKIRKTLWKLQGYQMSPLL